MRNKIVAIAIILLGVQFLNAQSGEQIDADYKKGKDFYTAKNYSAAEPVLRKAMEGYRKLNEQTNELYAGEYLAKTLHALAKYDDAIALNFALLGLAAGMNDQTGVGLANNRLGVNHYAKKDYAGSLIYFQGALAYYKQSGTTEDKKIALQNVIDCLNKLNKTEEAQTYLAEMSSLGGDGGAVSNPANTGPSFVTKSGVKIGNGSSMTKDGTWADEEFKKAKTLYNDANYTEAEEVLSEVVATYAKLGEEKNELYASEYLAKAYNKQGRYDEAIKLNFKLLGLAGKLQDMTGVGLANNRLGVNYYAKADYSSALIYFQAALAQSRQSGKPEDIKMDLKNVIDSLNKLGRTSEATTYTTELNKLK